MNRIIKYPRYTTNGCHYFRFLSEENCFCVRVSEYDGSYSIEKYGAFPESFIYFTETTKEVFNEKLKIAIQKTIQEL